MQLINAPVKLVLPFAASGAKNTIPVASQIGIEPGAASLTDGFPPLTRTPLAAGGVPPSGLDMNGIIYELSAILRWANAGGGYVYDGTFAADSNVGGYPKGARVLRSDGLGYWFNTTDNNTTDPEAGAAAAIAAGWVPDYTTGAAAITMASANVTLTPLQYGKPVIVITGTLTANLNLIFPNLVGEWTVINSTTGPYTVTCKTAARTGVAVYSVQAVVGDGVNIYSATNDAVSLLGQLVASAGGTADALTATFSPAPHLWSAGVPFMVRASTANLTTTPTFTSNSGTLAAKTIVKGSDGALAVGDIAGAGHWLLMQYDATLDKVVLLNPATGVTAAAAAASIQGSFKNLKVSSSGLAANVSVTVDEIALEGSGNAYATARALSLTINSAASGANGLDTGSLAALTWYSVWVIRKPDGTTAGLISTSPTAPTMPSGYTFKARVGWIRTDGTGNKYPLAFKQYGRQVQYVVTAGSNVTAYPVVASGVGGSYSQTTPTYVAASVSGVVPPTAGAIAATLLGRYGNLSPGECNAAPNASFSGSSSYNPPLMHIDGSTTGILTSAVMLLESSNVYYSGQTSGCALLCTGWDDNF